MVGCWSPEGCLGRFHWQSLGVLDELDDLDELDELDESTRIDLVPIDNHHNRRVV